MNTTNQELKPLVTRLRSLVARILSEGPYSKPRLLALVQQWASFGIHDGPRANFYWDAGDMELEKYLRLSEGDSIYIRQITQGSFDFPYTLLLWRLDEDDSLTTYKYELQNRPGSTDSLSKIRVPRGSGRRPVFAGETPSVAETEGLIELIERLIADHKYFVG